MNKINIFKNELEMIKDKELKKFAEYCLVRLPDYFFKVPASSTGKYHPSYTLGEGGLVRHTKAAIKIANDLLNLEQYQDLESDLIIFALLFHDGLKKGDPESRYTLVQHPILAAEFIWENLKDYVVVNDIPGHEIFIDKIDNIQALIKTHMGQWNYDYRSKKEVLPKPTTEAQKFVHLCDYLASRKYLIVEVE